ncbi:hypothetical protein ACP275_14G095600 [Erythranthe tilingii]
MKPIFLICILTLFVDFPPISSANAFTKCPLDLDYVLTIPWNTSDCIGYNHNPTNSSGGPTAAAAATSSCCQTLLSLYGVSLSQRLKNTSLFQLPDLPSSISCLENFQQKLTSPSLPFTLTSLCFDSLQFVISSNTCAAIQSTADWSAKLGNSTAVDASCETDLTDPSSCDACVAAGFRADLIAIDGDKSHSVNCFYFAVLYAAGIVNQYGPQSVGAVSCIFGLPIISHEKGSSNKRHSAILFGLTAAAIFAALSIFGFLALYLRRNRKNHAEGEDQVGSTRPRSRPTTISVSYKIEELERATDNFDPKNLIGRFGFSTVYKGTLSDSTIVAVKKITESDIQENNVEVIGTLKHINLVPIRGCCISEKNEKYLVSGDSPLTWRQRKSIIADVAKWLGYLHYGVKPAVFHGDLKATNVLLDNGMKARIADFGLAKQSRKGESNFKKSDVIIINPGYTIEDYSFEVVVLEVMCGRKVPEVSGCSIADWAWSFMHASLLNEGDSSKSLMERFVRVGILCARAMADSRPTIVDALKMLDGDILVPSIPDH